jgi:type I restriction enzyme R subunit
MANILPTAAKIGFTGTPLLTYDEITKRTFGDYVSIYDFKRAVEDGATVPLYYENRADKLGIQNPEITNELLDAIEQNDLDPKERARLERDLKREYHLLTSKKRLNTIAKDFVEHYTEVWTTGKAMFVCLDKVTAVKMHNLVREYWDKEITRLQWELKACTSNQEELELSRKIKWMTETEMAVVISEEQNEQKTFEKYGLDIIPHRIKMRDRNLEKEFKDEDNPFRIVFVCAMWLTGFDVKCLSVLYLDKPLKAHTLMQTIARANRVHEGKTNGLIVAYADIVESLKRALADYANSGKSVDSNPLLDKKELIARIHGLIAEITAFLSTNGFVLQELIDAQGITKLQSLAAASNAVCTTDDTRKHFEILSRELFKLFKYTEKGDIDRETYSKKNAISAIYNQLHVKSGRSNDYIELTTSLQKIIDDYIEVEPTDKREVREYNISMIDFERLAARFKDVKNKNLIVKEIRELVEDRMKKLLKTNPKRIDYFEHYKQIIEEYNKDIDKTEIEKTFLALTKLVQDLDEEEHRFIREGFNNDEELAIYDLLRKDELNSDELASLKKLSKELLDKIKEKIRITNQWREKEETVAELKNIIRKQLYAELPESYSIERIDCYSQRIFDHIYTAYPAA